MMHEDDEEEEFPIGSRQWATREEFDAYFERIGNRTATQKEYEDFNLMVMRQFCLDAWAGRPVDQWIMKYLADTFLKILAGGAWADEFHLPWMERTKIRSDAQQRGLEIYCFVKNELCADKDKLVTDALSAAANKFNCSYETARGQYYAWEKSVSKNEKQI